MWPFGKNRRHHPRHQVSWKARMHCAFPDFQETLPVEIVDISLGGARLHMKKLQAGSRHLVISQEPPKLYLKAELPQGSVESIVEIRWYDRVPEADLFAVGVEFIDLPEESLAILEDGIVELLKNRFGQPLP